jgi:hypothetical protein
LALVGTAGTASAENFTVGVFAPSAPFPSTAARVELASRLGEHVGKALGGTGTGRVYARAGDFAAAVKKGEITVALVDAAYLASGGGGPYTVIAAAQRGGSGEGWQLVARGGKQRVPDLKGKHVLVPSNGGRETDFVINVMLGGDVPRDHFSKIEATTDTASALAALGLGKADVAVVPSGVDLPGGVSVVLAMPSLAGSALVAYGNLTAAQRTALATAATGFKGDGTITGFRSADTSGIRAIQGRFSPAPKRTAFAVAPARFVVGDLLEKRDIAIERTSPLHFTAQPQPPSKPASR